MTDKIVTHEDQGRLESLRRDHPMDPLSPMAEMLDRLIAAAKADAPPLPEGWVLTTQCGVQQAQWHRGDGSIFPRNDLNVDGISAYGGRTTVDSYDSVTPLRPTFTEADVEKAAYAIFREYDESDARFDDIVTTMAAARAAFKAVGIEVAA